MNSPSYYYQHQSQNQLNYQQIDNDSDQDRSMSQISHQQHYQIYHNKFIPQNNKSHNITKQTNNKLNQQKIKNQTNYQNHFPHQHHQSKDIVHYNQDRSLKVNQITKKQQDLINKNKSLSSPSNHPHEKKIFKKQKQIKEPEKHQHSKANLKPKKGKVQKEKKISNGSLSTDITKTVTTKPKKIKVQNKKINEKSHNITKSLHNVSQQSNEFLVLGQNLYDYQDMSRVTTAKNFYDRKLFVNELQKQRNKKVKFNEKDRQLNERIKKNENSLSIYDPARLQKKVNKTILKIQKYMLGFIEAQTFASAKQETLQNTDSLSLQAKLQLYHHLIKDSQLSKQISKTNKTNQQNKIDDVIKLSIEKVQKKSQKLSDMYQQESGLITKWKNSKLHQLSTAKIILQRLMKEDHYQIKHIPHSNSNRNNDPQSTPNDLQQIEDFQYDPLYLLEKQLQQIMSEEYYPQLKKHTLTLRKSLTQLLKNQQFPEPKPSTQTEVVEQSRLQNTQNYFTPNGVLWFFQKFFTFITQKPNYISQLVQKLNQGFGFDVETKKVIAKTKDLQKWYDFFGQGQKSMNHKSLIDPSTFYQFQQNVIKPDPQLTQQTQKHMHYFNKAIIDSFNQQFHRYRPFYPYGQPLPNLQKPGKYFQITSQSIFYFFEKSKYHIYTNYITFFAGLILPEGQQETKQTKQYNVSKQVKLVNQQMLYDWQFYHCLLPVAKLATYQELYLDIQRQIYNQLANDLLKIKKNR